MDSPDNMIRSTCEQLLACLFYIELQSLPMFYSSPELCTFQIHCRVPPGPGLMDLLVKLRRQHASFLYCGSEMQYKETELCGDDTYNQCKDGNPYSKEIQAEIWSTNSSINIKVKGMSSKAYNISNCPYKIGRLVQDQGLNCYFGRSDHKTTYSTNFKQNISLKYTLNRLYTTLSSF